jgi:hypothetical protein
MSSAMTTGLSKSLRSARLRRKISLRRASRETRIPESTLEDFEAGRSAGLASAYESGLLAAYCRYLSVPSPIVRASRSRLRTRRLKTRQTIATSDMLRRGGLSLLLALAVGYGIWQSVVLVSPPRLSVDHPPADLIVYESSIEISGRTSPGSDLFINNQSVPIEPDGRFSQDITLQRGRNDIEIAALNTLGKRAAVRRTVVFAPRN